MTGAARLRKAQLKHRPDRTFSRCSLRRSGLQLRGVRGETRRGPTTCEPPALEELRVSKERRGEGTEAIWGDGDCGVV
jgi:hypothetical protein